MVSLPISGGRGPSRSVCVRGLLPIELAGEFARRFDHFGVGRVRYGRDAGKKVLAVHPARKRHVAPEEPVHADEMLVLEGMAGLL